MQEFFSNYSTILIFLHVVSAVIWIGGMIAIRVAVHPALQSIDDGRIKLGKTLQIVDRLFNLVIPFILILLATGIIFELAGIKGALTHAKEGIWTVMTINFIFMYIKRAKAQKLFNSGKLEEAKKCVNILPNILLPINIVLGMAAIMIGVILRGAWLYL